MPIVTNGLRAAALAALISSGVAGAQVAGAQTVQPPTREEVQRGQLEEELRRPAQPLSVEDSIERSACPLADPQFNGIEFTFREAQISGLDGVDPALVQSAYAPLIGQTLPIAAVCEIRDLVGTELRRNGYLASVRIPVQQIDDGVVRFDALLAKIAAVQVRGDAGPSEAALKKYIDKLVGDRAFNIDEAERYLLLARDIPGLDVRLTLRPAPSGTGATPGDVVGVIDVTRTPFYADLNIQNFGSRDVGRFGGLARVRFNGLTGLGDETTLSVFTTADVSEQQVYQGSHTFRLGGEGLVLGANFTAAFTSPDLAGPGPDPFESETYVGGAFAAFPIIRSQTRNLLATGGLDYIDQNIEFSSAPLSRDNLRIAYARLEYSTIDTPSLLGRGGYSVFEPRLALGGSLEVRQGLDIFGASESCGVGFIRCQQPGVVPPSRLDADPTGLVFRVEGTLDYRPTPKLKLTLRPRLQYSGDPLLSYEQFSGGNYTIGRGYDPGAVIGDSGYGVQAEMAYGSLLPPAPDAFAFQPYAFVDHIGAYTKNVPDDPQTVTSVGVGLRTAWGSRAFLETYLAVPLERAPLATAKGDVRALMTLSIQLAPWRN